MSGINHFLLKFLILAVMLLGLPLLGVWVAGYPVARYLEFPPQTRYVTHAPFSWLAFSLIAFSILEVVLPLAVKGFQSYKKTPHQITRSRSRPFPWWGWIGVITGLISWILAWTRFSWFTTYQPHTFSLLWFAYIIVVNALCQVRTGHCLMTDRTRFFLLLFPVSAGLQALMKEPHVFSQIAKGDWSGAVSAALAATVCGGFWEMWNWFSLAKWEYSIPLVHRFQIFEMPLLGYAGYLPFGLECAVIGSMVSKLLGRDSG